MVNAAIAATELGADVVGPDALEPDSEWSYLISFLPGPEVGRRAPSRSCATRSASGCSACRPSRGWTRACRSASCAPRRSEAVAAMNFALSDEQVLLREAARGVAVALQDGRGGARGARGPDGAARPVADRGRGRLARAADLRGARRRRARARSTRCWWPRNAAGCWPRCRCSACCRPRAILDAAGDESLAAVAAGELRPGVRARPARRASTEDALDGRPGAGHGPRRRAAATVDGDAVTLDGTVAFVPDAPGADLLVAVGRRRRRRAGGGGGRARRRRASRSSR